MNKDAANTDAGSNEKAKGHSVDHHPIEAETGPWVEQPGQGDALKKQGPLPLEQGNQYTHQKPEKD